jgi:diaminohydroxyphosphoribosylaminopyrimidine deaminase / 5-amino-6-(5-phosphoribosylamino)uracil reductase
VDKIPRRMKQAMTKLKLDRPKVTLKLATSLDGKIATNTGQSKWITDPEARTKVHKMRAAHDCVLTGIGTVLADDPELTARLDPRPLRQPLRVVLDSKGRTPATVKLLATVNQGPVCLFHERGHLPKNQHDDAQRLEVASNANGAGLDLHSVLEALHTNMNVASVMVEAGAQLAGAFLRAGLVDRIVWFRAPIIIGGDGLSVFASLGIDELTNALAFEVGELRRVGRDLMEIYDKRAET